MKEPHGFKVEEIDQDHILASKLEKLSEKPTDIDGRFDYIPGDIVVIQTLNATKNTKTYRSHELFEVCEISGATAFVRSYNRPLKEQPQFPVHINLLMKVNPTQMILNCGNIQESKAVEPFRNKQTTPTETTDKNTVY